MRSIKTISIFVLLFLLLTAVVLISLAVGQVYVPWQDATAVIFNNIGLGGNGFTGEQQAVIWHIRLPRVLVGMFVGAALAVSGAVMQGVFGNPLADPGIIGVSGGASFGAVVAISLGLTSMSFYYMPLFALGGALLAVGITVSLAMRQGKIPVMILLLAGVAVSIFMSALTSGLLTFMSEYRLREFLFWMVGGLDYRRWEHVAMAVGPITIGTIILCIFSRHLNVLVLGEQEAKAVGMSVAKMRLSLLFIASLTTAVAVCVSGSIGFVGLVVPHMVRMLLGAEHRIVLPASALTGAIFLVACDTIGRAVSPASEIRVGVVTAFVGAPYFLYLLRQAHKKRAFL